MDDTAVVVAADAVLAAAMAAHLAVRASKSATPLTATPSLLQLFAVAFTGFLGVAYAGLAFWMLADGEGSTKASSLHRWPRRWHAELSHGIYLILVSAAFSVRCRVLGAAFMRLWGSLYAVFAVIVACSSATRAVELRETPAVAVACLDALGLLPAALCLLYALKQRVSLRHDVLNAGLHERLNANDEPKKGEAVTPFATAGIISKMFFCWMNPVMRTGSQKSLDENEVPALGGDDQADTVYSLFLKELNSGKQLSLFWTIFSCHKKDIIVSGFFAMLKILTLSAGPMILKTFVRMFQEGSSFRYEGQLLALALLGAKCVESLSQRQWYFRARRLGLQVRSLLMAAIYRKQLRLSNAAKAVHSSGQITNYVTVDAYRIGEFPYWAHQTWTTSLQLCIALIILYDAVGVATIASMVVIVLTVVCNAPLAKLQHLFQSKLMGAQDARLKAMSESLVHMKVLKLYAWETHFKKAVEALREAEIKWLSAFLARKAYNSVLFWSSPVLVSSATFAACYFTGVPLNATNVFTFVATLRIVQDPVRQIPEVIGTVIQARVAFARVANFLNAPEMDTAETRTRHRGTSEEVIKIRSCSFKWDESAPKPSLRNINVSVNCGQKVAICGEVGSGKSTLLAAVLGEVPKVQGQIQVCGSIAYVSQSAWIQTGTVQENILFGSEMDKERYQKTLERCSLVKDLEMLPFGDQTQIGERGINLSGGQKQRVQLARALYKDADIYLLDDPFSAVDAHTAKSLFNEYIVGALLDKSVLLVTHQVDFLPVFDSILLMSDGEVLRAGQYRDLLASCTEFADLVNAHKDTIGIEKFDNVVTQRNDEITSAQVKKNRISMPAETPKPSGTDQLIRKEEREMGDTGLKPYKLYLWQNKGYLFALTAALSNLVFVSGQVAQNTWMARNVQNTDVSTLKLIEVYLAIGFCSVIFLIGRSLSLVTLGVRTSRSLFAQLLISLFRAPMSFFDSNPLGRIMSRVSADLSIVDQDVPFSLILSISSTENAYTSIAVLASVTWPVLFVAVPLIILTMRVQRYYLASAKELMRINGTTKSLVANHLAESISGAVTIRAFREENRFFTENLELIDKNASPYFHNFAATEWLIQRLEITSAIIISASAFVIACLSKDSIGPGFVGLALSYGLSMNNSFVMSIQNQCTSTNHIISVERVNQFMHITSEAPEIVENHRPEPSWPAVGKVELKDLKIRYREDAPLVLHGISCSFEGGHKIGIVGRTGSGKTTLISALFRLVEPCGGQIVVDGIDIVTIGLHDLRSRFAVIPQDPTLFHGTVRYNLDPLEQFTDKQIWEVLDKCQLREAVEEKPQGLDSLVVEEGSNWSMGQRQLFCLGRTLLRRSRIVVLDEATASIDNATDAIIQTTIRTEFRDSTVITVAHRIPTVMDCTKVLALRDGQIVEYDDPKKLMSTEGSLFRELVKEYWSHNSSSRA